MDIRSNWTVDEALALLTGPLDTLLAEAARLHGLYGAQDVQRAQLLSIKTGACPEDCNYCSQSAHYDTSLKAESLLPVEKVVEAAKEAKATGATRFCLGAAWRNIPPENDRRFTQLLSMVRGVAEQGLEVCCTLGMGNESQLRQLKEAGLYAYNHNLDTSREHYPSVVTTRSYDDRLRTLQAARTAGLTLCSGGILGLGETARDRAAMLVELASIDPHPESVPINLLVPIPGTPFQKNEPVPFEEFLRTVATARVLMPRSRVRLSAGRNTMSDEQQLQCFAAGANSIFVGDRLLTANNVEKDFDAQLIAKWKQKEAAGVSAAT